MKAKLPTLLVDICLFRLLEGDFRATQVASHIGEEPIRVHGQLVAIARLGLAKHNPVRGAAATGPAASAKFDFFLPRPSLIRDHLRKKGFAA